MTFWKLLESQTNQFLSLMHYLVLLVSVKILNLLHVSCFGKFNPLFLVPMDFVTYFARMFHAEIFEIIHATTIPSWNHFLSNWFDNPETFCSVANSIAILCMVCLSSDHFINASESPSTYHCSSLYFVSLLIYCKHRL